MTLGVVIALAVSEIIRGRSLVTPPAMLLPMFMAPVIVGLLGVLLDLTPTYGLYAWFLRETGIYSGDILGSTTSAFLAVTRWTCGSGRR